MLELSSGIDRDHQLSPNLVKIYLIEKKGEPGCPYSPQLSPLILLGGWDIGEFELQLVKVIIFSD